MRIHTRADDRQRSENWCPLRVELLEDRCLLAGGLAAPPPATRDFLLVPSKDTDNVLRYDAASGAFVDEFVRHKDSRLNQPTGAIYGPHDHNLYVGSGFYGGPGQKRAVLRYDGTTGKFIDEFTAPGHLEKVNQILFGPDGNGDGKQDMYVSNGIEFGPGMVARFDGITGAFIDNFVPPSDRLRGPRGMVFGPSLEDPRRLNLYLASGFAGIVSRFDALTGVFLGEIDTASAGLGYAVGVTFGPDGNLYVATNNFDPPHAHGGPNGVVRFQGPGGRTPGALIDVFVLPGSGGLLDPPGGLLFGPDGNGDGRQDLYVASLQWVSSYETKEHTSSVKRYDGVTGAYLDTFVAPDSGGLSGPWLMAFARTDPMTLAYPSSVPTGAASAPVTTDRGQASALLAVGNSANSTVRETAGRDKSPPVSSSQVPRKLSPDVNPISPTSKATDHTPSFGALDDSKTDNLIDDDLLLLIVLSSSPIS